SPVALGWAPRSRSRPARAEPIFFLPPLPPRFRLDCGFGFAPFICLSGGEPLSLGFLGFALRLGVGGRLGLALFICLSGGEPLLLRFLAVCFGSGAGFGLVRAMRVRLLRFG